jgi:hypothetical protein
MVTPYTSVPNPDGLTSPEPFFSKFDILVVRIRTIMNIGKIQESRRNIGKIHDWYNKELNSLTDCS